MVNGDKYENLDNTLATLWKTWSGFGERLTLEKPTMGE